MAMCSLGGAGVCAARGQASDSRGRRIVYGALGLQRSDGGVAGRVGVYIDEQSIGAGLQHAEWGCRLRPVWRSRGVGSVSGVAGVSELRDDRRVSCACGTAAVAARIYPAEIL